MKYVIFVFLGFVPYLTYIGEFLAIYGLGMLMFANPSYTLNSKGVNLLDSYKNLKKYLEDFSKIENKTAQMVELWNYYLTYSIALEIDSIASEELRNFFGTGIFQGTYTNKKSHLSSKKEGEELQLSLKEWKIIFEKERIKELQNYEDK